jgi:hypothetical protein
MRRCSDDVSAADVRTNMNRREGSTSDSARLGSEKFNSVLMKRRLSQFAFILLFAIVVQGCATARDRRAETVRSEADEKARFDALSSDRRTWIDPPFAP